jgi:hypothetical protein
MEPRKGRFAANVAKPGNPIIEAATTPESLDEGLSGFSIQTGFVTAYF